MSTVGSASMNAGSIVRRARRLRFRVGPLALSELTGAYRSARPGSGLTFSELRPYEPGDDVRHLDWNVTARQGRPFVRKYVEERSLLLWLIIDVSSSLQFGTPGSTKADRAMQAAALLSTAAILGGDRVALILVTDRVEVEIPPGGGARHLARLTRALVATVTGSRRTDLAAGLPPLLRSARKASVVVISDFLDPEPPGPWSQLSRKHPTLAIRIVDPREESLPNAGLVDLVDAEDGSRQTLDTGSLRVRNAYARLAHERHERFRRWCAGSRITRMEMSTVEDPLAVLLRHFRDPTRVVR